MTEQDGDKKFKIVDRRRFTEEGDLRTGPDVAPAEPVRKDPPPSPVAAPPPAAAKPEQPAAAGADKPKKKDEAPPGALSFSLFVQSLAQQALMQLGLIPWPHGQRELHLEQARDTVDILQLLKQKTTGNLSAEESQLLDTAIQELKLSWVEVQQAIARSKGAGMPRPPGR